MRILHNISNHLELRPLVIGDFQEYRAVRKVNTAWLIPWEPLISKPDPAVDATAFALRCTYRWHQWEHDVGYHFGVFVSGDLVGEVNINNVLRGSIQQASIGYWIAQNQAGKGIIPEAVRLVSAFAFEELQLNRLQIAIIPRNKASLRVVEKLGWRYEGLGVSYLQINGEWEDHKLFAMTASEWFAHTNK